MDNKSLSHVKWKCQYHIVFIPKYRKILYGRLKKDVREMKIVKNLLKQIAFWTRLLQNQKDYLNHNLVVHRKINFKQLE